MDGDILSLVDFPLRVERVEEASSVDKMSFCPAEDIKDIDKFFPVVQNHCKQVLKELNDTHLDFILLLCEDDDESFTLITCLCALATFCYIIL